MLASFGIRIPLFYRHALVTTTITIAPPPAMSTAAAAAASASASDCGNRFQHLIVMRHGDRIDNFEPLWTANAERPWDPPLVEAGRVRAFCTGRKLREARVGFPIHRVFVSPFLRCIQTAREVAIALSSVDGGDDINRACSDEVKFDSSKLKVRLVCFLLDVDIRMHLSVNMRSLS